MADGQGNPPEQAGTKPRRSRSEHADAPYAVGKYKPPVEHQFKPGNRRGGRKPGSRNQTDLQKLLDTYVVIGEDRLGRPIRRRWRDVINRQLIKRAAEGDLAAIRLVMEFDHKMEALKLRGGSAPLTEAEHAKAAAEHAENDKFRRTMIDQLDLMAALKRHGLIDTVEGRLAPAPWAVQAANTRKQLGGKSSEQL